MGRTTPFCKARNLNGNQCKVRVFGGDELCPRHVERAAREKAATASTLTPSVPSVPAPAGFEPGIPPDLYASLPLDVGPTAEPIATAPRAELPPVELDGDNLEGHNQDVEPARHAATWKRHLEHALPVVDGMVSRRFGTAPLVADEIDWLASVWGDVAAEVLAKVDPNNPWGAAIFATFAVYGPRTLEGFRNRGQRAPLRIVKEPSTRTESPLPNSPMGWAGPEY